MCGAGGGCRTGRPPSCSRGIHHLGRAQDGRTERLGSCDEFSGDEVSAQLGWSRTMSSRKLDLADDLAERLPEVGDALYARVARRTQGPHDLRPDPRPGRRPCPRGVPDRAARGAGAAGRGVDRADRAGRDGAGPAVGPAAPKRAEARARVILSSNPSGTANLSFCDAPAPDGIASQARIDALAATVRHLGVLIPINQLRLQVGLRLLDGSTAGMDDRTIALLLAAEHHAQNTPDDPTTGPTTPVTTVPTADDGPGRRRPGRRRPRRRRARRRGPRRRPWPADDGPAPTALARTTTPSRPCLRRGHRRSRASSTSPTCLMWPNPRRRSTRPTPARAASGKAASRSGSG